jgi:hypothetical protein
MTPDERLSRPMGQSSGVIPDTAAPDREREGSPSRQIARPVDDRDRGYVASITAGRQAKDACLWTAADGPLRGTWPSRAPYPISR